MTKFGRLIGNMPFHKVPRRHDEHSPVTIQTREEMRRQRVRELRARATRHRTIASAKGRT